MKHLRIVVSNCLIILSLVFISCDKNGLGSDKSNFIDIEFIWIGDENTWELTHVNDDFTYRNAYAYHVGEEPYWDHYPSSFHDNGVEYLEIHYYKCKWIHYYKNDNYIEFEKVGVDKLESLDLSNYLIYY